MPEGPSVLACAHRLHESLSSARVMGAEIVGGRYKTHGPPAGWHTVQAAIREDVAIIHGVGCKGKLLWWKLGKDLYLLSTLGLSGSWTHRRGKHSTVGLQTNRGAIWFTDQLHYGTVSFVSRSIFRKKLARLGPDVLASPPPSYEVIKGALTKRSAWTLPRVLMDQSKVSGIGNYLKAEILYAAKLAPHRTVDSLSSQEMRLLYLCMVLIPRTDLAKRGIVVEDIQLPWRFRMQVYGKKRDPQGRAVERLKTADKRVTHWVPTSQI